MSADKVRRWPLAATTNYERAGVALTKEGVRNAPPPWPLGDDPRTPQCTHVWDRAWGVEGERQRRCKHCRRYVWEHEIDDPDLPRFDGRDHA